jgi:hypothetical protein
MAVADLFTMRAAIVISVLRNAIEQVPCAPSVRDCLLLAFLSSLAQSSRLHSIDFRPGRTYASRGWTIASYWVASGHFEQNALLSFRERARKILRGKQDSNRRVPNDSKEASTFKELQGDCSFLLANLSARRIGELVPESSVDYVFTDPPYGDSITYLELAEIANAWLGMPSTSLYADEVVMSDAEERYKDLATYQGQLQDSFEAIYRVMKPGAWMSVTFHNRNLGIWNALLNAAVEAHFDFVNDVYQLPAAASAKSGLQQEGSMTGDIVLNFRKPIGTPSRIRAGSVDVEALILEEAQQIIGERSGRATEDQLMRGVVHVLLRHGVVDKSPDDIRNVLERRFQRETDGTWISEHNTQATTVLDYIPLEKRILWLIESAVASGPASLDEILRRIFTSLKNGRTPQNREILTVLEAACVQMENGAWRLRSANDGAVQLSLGVSTLPETAEQIDQQDEVSHDQFVRMVAEWASQTNLTPYVGRTERRGNVDLRSLGLPRLTIPGIEPTDISRYRIDEIDVVWLQGGTLPRALFEIEHTTRAMTCIPRLGNLTRLVPHLAMDVFLVGPDGLQAQVFRQLEAPSGLAVTRDHPSAWYFLPYSKALALQDAMQDSGSVITLELVRRAAIRYEA